MFSIRVLWVFSFIAVILAEEDKLREENKIFTECGNANNLKDEDFENIVKTKEAPSEDMLCFLKCIVERDGSMKNGKIIADSSGTFVEMLKDKTKNKTGIEDCVKKIPEVKNCADMRAVTACFPGALPWN